MTSQLQLCGWCLCLTLASLAACSDGVKLPAMEVGVGNEAPVSDNRALPDLAPHATGFIGTYFSGSGQCSSCHDGLVDERGADVSIVQDWSSSMMANAARDPYWIAKVAAEIHRNPDLENTLNDSCTRCHAPMANDAGRKDKQAVVLLGEGTLLDADNALFDHAMEGVSCTLCHQLEDDGLLGTVEGVSGNFNIRTYTVASDRPAYGPYADPSGAFMQAQVQFLPQYGPHLSTAESCAACHDLRTPGSPTTFPEQMVYSEWQNSAYATAGMGQQNCQSCHMPVVEGPLMLATRGGGVPREEFSRHTFLGGNTVMQTILKDYRAELGIDTSAEQFDLSIQRNREFLKSAATVQIVSGEFSGTQLLARVRIANRAGHKLPSGFASRRVHVHLVVTDTGGDVVFESGRVNADGSIFGVATDADSNLYESHYEVIEAPDQVQVYEAIMGDAGGAVTHTLMNAETYLKDNRLLPVGFDKVSAPDDIRTAGLASGDPDFDSGGDQIEYRIDVAAGQTYTISVELIYQALAYGHLQDLFDSGQLPEVQQFKTLFDAATIKAETLARDTLTLSQ